MIQNLEIKNFKSIKHLKLNCKRINIFIGKPNTGKSNILESVGFFSFPYDPSSLKSFIRFENMTNLFYDQDLEEKIIIIADNFVGEIRFEKNIFIGEGGDRENKVFNFNFKFDYNGSGTSSYSPTSPFRFYRFEVAYTFPIKDFLSLLPPKGKNLLSILLTNKGLRRLVTDIFSDYELRIVLNPQEDKIEVQKEIEEDVIISYPYSLVSDTLQRVVFYLVAIETSKDSFIIFEEPEAHAFPYYTKFLAERISLDKTNQYFISTHNPYFLLSILEKTPQNDVGIFITYLEEFQTRVKRLTEKEKQEILDLDASLFFNLNEFIGKE